MSDSPLRPPWPPNGPIRVGRKLLVHYAGGSPFGWHRCESFAVCNRLYAFKRAGWDLNESLDALIVGGLVHTGLGQLYAIQGLSRVGSRVQVLGEWFQGSSARDAFYMPAEAVEIAGQLTDAPDALVLFAKGIVEQYVGAKGAGDYAQMETVGIEVPIEVQFAPDLPPYTMLVDWLVRDATGTLTPWDHKTSSHPQMRLVEEYAMSGQFTGHVHGLQVLAKGAPFKLPHVNVVGKTAHYTGLRSEVPITKPMIAEFPSFVAQRQRRILAQEQAMPPKDNPYAWEPRWSGGSGDGCRNRYRMCGARDLCRQGAGSPHAEEAQQGKLWSPERA